MRSFEDARSEPWGRASCDASVAALEPGLRGVALRWGRSQKAQQKPAAQCLVWLHPIMSQMADAGGKR